MGGPARGGRAAGSGASIGGGGRSARARSLPALLPPGKTPVLSEVWIRAWPPTEVDRDRRVGGERVGHDRERLEIVHGGARVGVAAPGWVALRRPGTGVGAFGQRARRAHE